MGTKNNNTGKRMISFARKHWLHPRAWLELPSGKRLHNYGKIHTFLIGKSTVNGNSQ